MKKLFFKIQNYFENRFVLPFRYSEYALSAVPKDLIPKRQNLVLSFLNETGELSSDFTSDILEERIAAAACKAAVKGKTRLSVAEASALIDQLLSLENPYHCPHGRPTIIKISKYELEKKFKRIL